MMEDAGPQDNQDKQNKKPNGRAPLTSNGNEAIKKSQLMLSLVALGVVFGGVGILVLVLEFWR